MISSSSGETKSTAQPFIAFLDDLPMDIFDRTNIQATGRLGAISSLIGRENSRATMTFCWLPPESVDAGIEMLGVRISNCLTRSFGRFFDLLTIQVQARGERGFIIGIQDQVILDRE